MNKTRNYMNLHEIDEAVFAIEKIFYNYKLITPLNTGEELKKFLKDKTYCPQLEYKPFDVRPHLNRLEKINISSDSVIGRLLEKKRQYLINYAKALTNLGTDKFSTEKVHGKVSPELLKYAKDILSKPLPKADEEEKNISDEELAQAFRKKIESYNLKGWNINLLKNASSSAAVSPSKKTISIRANNEFSEKHKNKLLVHEIETHVLRTANGELQDYKLFSTGLPDYLSTEEGLAYHNEKTQKVNNPLSVRTFVIRVLATHLANMYGFTEVFNELRKYYSDDESAFNSVIRAKRGMGDTSKPGGFLKDHVYLQGMLTINDYVKNGGDVKLLYAGKIGVKDVYLVKEGIIKPAKILPEFIK